MLVGHNPGIEMPVEELTGQQEPMPTAALAVIQLGLLILIATPVVRVAASVVAFAVERDRLYVAITLYVLAVILVSFFLGQVAG